MGDLETLKKSLDDYLRSLKKARFDKLKLVKFNQRISQLSKPKQQIDSEDLIGPGSYEPKDFFLSTKSKSPTIRIGKSSRFRHYKELKASPMKVSSSNDSSPNRSHEKSFLLSDHFTNPGFTFKRTGHNLKLVENPDFPGVGRYTPVTDVGNKKAYSFKRSKREFNWKNEIKKLVQVNEFQRKFLND